MSTPEEQGMDSTALARLIEFGTSRSFDSLLIVRHGRIVLDAYYAPYSADMPHAINSVTKAVIGTLTAIAYKDGLLDSLDHRVMDFLGDRNLTSRNPLRRYVDPIRQNCRACTPPAERQFPGSAFPTTREWSGWPRSP
ncbi:beta-lactamase family protein [Bradyrhizobium retamae]|nr:beta-lactamase family protein [Bradyrhizobium retamae]